jgi:hypothetical protein
MFLGIDLTTDYIVNNIQPSAGKNVIISQSSYV